MTNKTPVQGFIKYRGNMQAALKVGDKVARYPSADDPGQWVSKDVASTFYAKPWNRDQDFERLSHEIHMIDEFNRLMPERSVWGSRDKSYDCIMCGAVVHDRNLHMTWHHKQDARLLATLEALFGGDQ